MIRMQIMCVVRDTYLTHNRFRDTKDKITVTALNEVHMAPESGDAFAADGIVDSIRDIEVAALHASASPASVVDAPIGSVVQPAVKPSEGFSSVNPPAPCSFPILREGKYHCQCTDKGYHEDVAQSPVDHGVELGYDDTALADKAFAVSC